MAHVMYSVLLNKIKIYFTIPLKFLQQHNIYLTYYCHCFEWKKKKIKNVIEVKIAYKNTKSKVLLAFSKATLFAYKYLLNKYIQI